MKILAIDYGLSRCGLAFGNSELLVALPLCILATNEDLIKKILEIATEKEIEKILIGAPYELNGAESEQTKAVYKFIELLKKETKLKIELFDERLSSKEAEKKLKGSGIKQDDDIAATNFLQTYLEKFYA